MKIVELKVSRFKYSPKSTIGMLYVDNILFGYTLEDPVRRLEDKNKDGDFDDAGEGKIYGQTQTQLTNQTYHAHLVHHPTQNQKILQNQQTTQILPFQN